MWRHQKNIALDMAHLRAEVGMAISCANKARNEEDRQARHCVLSLGEHLVPGILLSVES